MRPARHDLIPLLVRDVCRTKYVACAANQFKYKLLRVSNFSTHSKITRRYRISQPARYLVLVVAVGCAKRNCPLYDMLPVLNFTNVLYCM